MKKKTAFILSLLLCVIITFQSSAQENPTTLYNLKAFAKLYGYVRFFHPSDEASDINWDPDNNNANTALEGEEGYNGYLAVYEGIDPGGSLDIGGTTSTLHKYVIYGRSAQKKGEAII